MHIKKVSIQNLRSIRHFEMEFEQPAGWHVLIGDNGSGKTSVLRGMALGLVGSLDSPFLRLDILNYINYDEKKATIKLFLVKHDIDESLSSPRKNHERGVNLKDVTGKMNGSTRRMSAVEPILDYEDDNSLAEKNGWFSVGFGTFRRFTGGDKDIKKLYTNYPKVTGHLSLFGEDVALTEALKWLVKLNYKRLEGDGKAATILESLKTFINDGKLLPHNTKVTKISSDGVFLTDGNGQEVNVIEMSNGFRSVLSMTFEIIRQMDLHFDVKEVFKSIKKGKIDVPGVVMIDEIDAHLHPTWQTEIGLWFTEHFPNIQFIVTTHSPLVCRACERGSIWRLAAPGSGEESREVTGIEKERLIVGNILDAYGTDLFGRSPARAAKSDEKRKRLGELNILHALGKIEENEEKERRELQKTFVTE